MHLTKRITISSLLAPLFLSALVACTEKGSPTKVHQVAAQRDSRDQTQATDPKYDADPRPATSKSVKAMATAEDPVAEVLQPLAKKALNSKRVSDPVSLTSKVVQEELIELNSAILASSETVRERPEFKLILEAYSSAL